MHWESIANRNGKKSPCVLDVTTPDDLVSTLRVWHANNRLFVCCVPHTRQRWWYVLWCDVCERARIPHWNYSFASSLAFHLCDTRATRAHSHSHTSSPISFVSTTELIHSVKFCDQCAVDEPSVQVKKIRTVRKVKFTRRRQKSVTIWKRIVHFIESFELGRVQPAPLFYMDFYFWFIRLRQNHVDLKCEKNNWWTICWNLMAKNRKKWKSTNKQNQKKKSWKIEKLMKKAKIVIVIIGRKKNIFWKKKQKKSWKKKISVFNVHGKNQRTFSKKKKFHFNWSNFFPFFLIC